MTARVIAIGVSSFVIISFVGLSICYPMTALGLVYFGFLLGMMLGLWFLPLLVWAIGIHTLCKHKDANGVGKWLLMLWPTAAIAYMILLAANGTWPGRSSLGFALQSLQILWLPVLIGVALIFRTLPTERCRIAAALMLGAGLIQLALIDQHSPSPGLEDGLVMMAAVWVMLAPALFLIIVAAAKLEPKPKNQCPNCGYSLEGLPSPVCPECGSAPASAR